MGTMAIVLVFLVALIVLLPYILDLNRYRDHYLLALEEALDRKIEVEDVQLTVFPTLGVHLKNVVIADDPIFSSQPFMTVPSVQVVVRWKPLLQRRIQVERVLVNAPSLQVIRSSKGELNTSTMGKRASSGSVKVEKMESKNQISPLMGVFAVEQLTMTGGNLHYEDRMHQSSQVYQINDLAMDTDSVAIGETASIAVNGMVMPFQMPFEMKGRLGPIQPNLDIPEFDIHGNAGKVVLTGEGSMINGQLTLDVQVPNVSTDDVPFKIGLEKPVELSQIQARLVADLSPAKQQASSAEVTIDPFRTNLHLGQSIIHVSGSGTPSHFSFAGESASLRSQDFPFHVPVPQHFLLEQIEFEAEWQGEKLYIQSLEAKGFEGALVAQGVLNQTGSSVGLSSKGTFKDFSIDSVIKVVRPSLFRVMGKGELDWRMTGADIASRLPKLEGPVNLILREGEVVGFDLIRVVEDALQMPGVLGQATRSTKFSRIEARTELQQDGLVIQEIIAKAPNFSLRGRGMMGWDQSMNVQGTLAVPPAIADKLIQRFPMASVVKQKGQLMLPFVVRGTVHDPVFRIDTKSLGNQVKKNVEERLEKVLQGDDQELQKLLDEGKDLLKQFFRR